MITNPGFTFTGISGEHKIVPTIQTDLPVWGPLYDKALVCVHDGELVKVYDNGPGFNYTDNSVAMEFAAIDINDNEAIIKFCNKYGMPDSMRQLGNFRNDYIFFGDSKDDFSKAIPLATSHERTWLFTTKRDIVYMQKTIQLNQAIQDRDYIRILEILLYLCFDLSGLDFDGSNWNTETFQFNHHFFRYAEEHGFNKESRKTNGRYPELISGFLDDIDNSRYESKVYQSIGIPHKDKYVQDYFSMWQHLHSIFSAVIGQVTVVDISPFGDINFSKDPASILLKMDNSDRSNLIKVGKGVFTDIFKEQLHRVYPEIIYGKDGAAESSWRIPTLIDAMYLELFFLFTPNSSVRKCENPTCQKYFIRTSSRPSKKYCDDACAKLMAKRMERARKRKAKQETE